MSKIFGIPAKVVKIERKREALRTAATGKDEFGRPTFETEYIDRGWFVLFEGSCEYLHLGFDEPDAKAGDEAEIRIIFK